MVSQQNKNSLKLILEFGKQEFFITALETWGIVPPSMHAVWCLTPRLYHPVMYICVKFPGMFIHIYSIS